MEMVQILQGIPFVSHFFFFTLVQWLPSPTSVYGRCCKTCIHVCVCLRQRDRERKGGGGCVHGGLYVWKEGVLVEEVASYKRKLMSTTLIRSPIHQCAQGPIHPRSPGQNHTLAYSLHGVSLPQNTPHKCQDRHPDAYTHKRTHTDSYAHAY